RVDNTFGEKVQKFNELMEAKRFGEAESVAREALQAQPDNPVGEAMYYKSKLAAQDLSNQQNGDRKADAFTNFLNDVDATDTLYTDKI
ncbi:hypothetical protein N4A85_24795, partial [Escherichia coli]|uniref:hypothetical protein n=1 Tax=Escherichia coli TaxID=562 RepID=UPI0021B6D05C